MGFLFEVTLNDKDSIEAEFASFQEVLDTVGPEHEFVPGGELSGKNGTVRVKAVSQEAEQALQSYWEQASDVSKNPHYSIVPGMAHLTPYSHPEYLEQISRPSVPEPIDTRAGRVYLMHSKDQDIFNKVVKNLRPFDRNKLEPVSHPRFGTILDPNSNLVAIVDFDRTTNSYNEAVSQVSKISAHKPAVAITFSNGVSISGPKSWVLTKQRELTAAKEAKERPYFLEAGGNNLTVDRVEGDASLQEELNASPTVQELPAEFFNNLIPKKAVNPDTGKNITLFVVSEKALDSLKVRDEKGQPVARLNASSPSETLRAGDIIDLSGQMSQSLTVKEADLTPTRKRQAEFSSPSM